MNDITTLSIILLAQDKASSILSGLSKKFQDLGFIGNDTGKKIEDLGNKNAAAAEKLKTIGAIAAGVTAVGVAAIGVESVRAAANFQTLTERLVTSAGESQANLAKVQSGILGISTQTGASSDELAKAMYIIESAGQHGAAGLTVLKAAAQGAAAENSDVATVANAVTGVLTDYHLKATAAADVTSKLIAAVSQGKTNFQDLSASMASVLPIASAAHVSFTDTITAISQMTIHDMSAQQASDDLAHSIQKMLNPTQGMTQAMAQLGINSADLNDMLSKKGVTGTLETLSQAIMQHMGPSGKVLISAFNQSKLAGQDLQIMLKNMPSNLQGMAQDFLKGSLSLGDLRKEMKQLPANQANLIQQFIALHNTADGFNQQLRNGSNASKDYIQMMQAVTGDTPTLNTALMLTGENYSGVASALGVVNGATADAKGQVKGFAEQQQTFNAKLNDAKAALANTGIALGSALLPPLTAVLNVIVKIVSPIADWVAAHQQLAAIILGSIGAIATFVAVTLTIASAIDKTKDAFIQLSKVFISFGEDGALSLNPIGLAIIGIALLAYFVIDHWATVKKWFDEFWAKVKTDATAVKDHLIKAWDDIKKWVISTFDSVKAKFEEADKWIEKHRKGLEQIATVILIIVGPALLRLAVMAINTAATMILQAINTGLAWANQAVISGAAWTAQFIVMVAKSIWAGAQSALNAAVAGGAWIIQAGKSAAEWALQFIAMVAKATWAAAQFVVKSIIAGDAWILQAGKSVGVWLAGFTTMDGAAASFAAIASAPITPVLLIAAALAGLTLLISKTMEWKSALDQANSAADKAQAQQSRSISAIHNDYVSGKISKATYQRLIAGINSHATGTIFSSGGLALVGERGPELVTLPTGAQVTPAGPTQQALKQATGQTHYHLTVNVGTYAGQPGEIDNIATEIYKGLQRIARRHGKADLLPNIGILPQ